MTWDAYPGEDVDYGNFYAQECQGTRIYYNVHPSKGWLRSDAPFTYTLPDFSSVEGWNNAWSFKEGTEIFWSVGADAESGEFGEEGYEAIYVDRSGVVTP